METSPKDPPHRYNPIGTKTYIFIGLFGVLLPLGTIGFELVTRICTEVLFNPLPSWLHLILVTSVPLSILWTLLNLQSQQPNVRLIRLLMGIAFAISLVYTIRLLPFLPFSFIGIIAYGLGLIPMAPLFTLISTAVISIRTNELADDGEMRPGSFKKGIQIGLMALLAISFTHIVTWTTLAWNGPKDEFPNGGIKILRWFGSDNALLSRCYFENGEFWFGLTPPMLPRPNECRDIYYRVTGTEFSQDGFPKFPFSRFHQEGRRWDTFRGSLSVGHTLPNLFMVESRIDGFVEMDGNMGYLEWTQEFLNNASDQAEARCVIELPEGGVVSRVTLWINGEEKEAAFGGREKTIEAYQRVVRVRRDPLLVTSAGDGFARVQCFPIAPDGGTMRIRVGITFPTSPNSADTSHFLLPRIIEQNFRIKPQVKHVVWMESHSLWSGVGETGNQRNKKSNAYMLRKNLTAEELKDGSQRLEIESQHHESNHFYCPLNDSEAILASFSQSPRTSKSWILVLDGSKTEAKVKKQIQQALSENTELNIAHVLVAHDGLHSVSDPQSNRWNWPNSGGQNNLEALTEAVELAQTMEDPAILWIHGNQPAHTLKPTEIFQARLRMGDLPEFYNLPLTDGFKHAGQTFESFWKMTRIPRVSNNAADDLEHFILTQTSNTSQPALTFSKVQDLNNLLGSNKTSDHLVRLWANEEVGKLIYGLEPNKKAAQRLAIKSRLVTPVSGAVVLETQEQYDRANLKPGDPNHVPTVPEPKTYGIIGALFLTLLAIIRRWKRSTTKEDHPN